MRSLAVFAFVASILVLLQTASAFTVSPADIDLTVSHNSSTPSSFIVTPTNKTVFTDVAISSSSLFDLQFATTSVNLDNVKPINFNVVVPPHIIAGEYRSFIFVTGINVSKVLTVDVTVTSNESFQMNNTFNFTANEESKGYVFLDFFNNGNVPITFNVTSDQAKVAPTAVESQPGVAGRLPVFFDLEDELGEFIAHLDVKGRDVVLRFDVEDNQNPVFRNIVFNREVRALDNVEILVEASDNVGVSNVWIETEGRTVNLDADEAMSTFTKTINFTQVGENGIDFIINDTSNNRVRVSKPIVVSTVGEIEYIDFTPLSISRAFKLSQPIMVTPVAIPVKATLKEFSVPVNSSFVMFLENSGFGSAELAEDQAIDLAGVNGELRLVFGSDIEGDYSGRIQLDVPEYVGASSTIDFRVFVSNATVLDRRTFSVRDKIMDCVLNNTGFLHTSVFICTTMYPATGLPTSAPIPFTQDEYNLLVSAESSERKVVEGERDGARLLVSALIVLIVFSVISLFLIYLRKFSGFKMKLK